MHPQVAGVAEGLAAVVTLVRFHPDVTHEVHVELRGRDESPGTHAAVMFLLPDVTPAFCSGRDTAGVPAPVVVVVCLFRWMTVTRPRRGGGAGGSVGELLLLVNVPRLLLRLLLRCCLLLGVVLMRRAVVVLRLVVVAQVRLQLGEGRALFTALTDLTFRHLRNT